VEAFVCAAGGEPIVSQVSRLLGSVAISSSQNVSKQSSQTGSFKGKSLIRSGSRRPSQTTQPFGLRAENGITFFIVRLFEEPNTVKFQLFQSWKADSVPSIAQEGHPRAA
jgi:hypothetical protein